MPQKSQTIIVDLAEEISQAIAFGTLLKLNWGVKYAGEKMLIASTPRRWNGKRDEISVETSGNQLTVTSKFVNGEMVDIAGRNKKHITAFTETFDVVKKIATPNDINDWQTQIAKLKEETIQEAQREISRFKEADKVMNFSTGNMYVTYAIIAINTGIFILMVAKGMDFFAPSTLDVLKWGGSLPGLTLGGDWWRLITSTFLHFGIIHLALNMYALYFIGTYLEPMLGKTRYIIAYLCAGVAASLVSVMWHKGEIIVSAGASGAIFGMFGVFLALLTTNIIPKHIKGQLMQSIVIFIAYNVYNGFRHASGIDNSAHLGGLVSGMLIGYLYYFSFKQPTVKKTQMIAAGVVAITLLVSFVILKEEKVAPLEINFDSGKMFTQNDKLYNKKLEAFGALEEKALLVDREDTADAQKAIQDLQNISIPTWKEAKTVIDESVPYAETEEQKRQGVLLKKYIDLRLKFTDVRIRALKENTAGYNREINQIGEEIEAVISELSAKPEEKPSTNGN